MSTAAPPPPRSFQRPLADAHLVEPPGRTGYHLRTAGSPAPAAPAPAPKCILSFPAAPVNRRRCPPYEIFCQAENLSAHLTFFIFPVDSHDGMHYNVGNWQKHAEAKKVGRSSLPLPPRIRTTPMFPDCSDLDIPEDTDYVYICENETIHGVTWNKLPNTKGHVLVSDQSSTVSLQAPATSLTTA